MSNVLMTGASGMLGRNLLERMLRTSDDHFYLILRDTPRSRDLEAQLADNHPNRFTVIPGDVAEKHCGVELRTIYRLAQIIDAVWHSAASTEFDESKRRHIFEQNLGGTHNLLGMMSNFQRLDDYFHISTAYVSGTATGTIPETDFVAPAFKNPYEHSKSESEAIVRGSGLPFTILRPSIFIGDSRTLDPMGERRMIYGYCLGLYMTALAAFKKQGLGGSHEFWDWWQEGNSRLDLQGLRCNADPTTTQNAICIDDTADVFNAIRQDPTRHNKTYHVVNPRPLTTREIIDTTVDLLHCDGVRYDPELRLDQCSVPGEKMLLRATAPYLPYVHIHEPTWDHANTAAVVPDSKRVVMSPHLFRQLIARFFDKQRSYMQQTAVVTA